MIQIEICYCENVDNIILILKQFGLIIVIGAAGVGLLVYGICGQLMPQETTVEVVKAAQKTEIDQIVVDVEGAVAKPGLYKLPRESRIGDALVSSGGLADEADRAWVGQNINLAETLKDGSKVYVPSVKEKKAELSKQDIQPNTVNINTASSTELDKLEGIGESRAITIIDNRPYASIDELVSKAKLPKSIVDKIKDQISVY